MYPHTTHTHTNMHPHHPHTHTPPTHHPHTHTHTQTCTHAPTHPHSHTNMHPYTHTYVLLYVSVANTGCGLNFHKRCAVNIPNNCSRLQTSTSEFSASSSKKASKELWSGRPLWIDRALQERPELPHTFAIKTYTSLTACHHCKRLVMHTHLCMLWSHMMHRNMCACKRNAHKPL